MLRVGAGMDVEERRRLLEVAQQRRPPDLVITGGTVANVYSGEWLRANVEISGRRIAYVGPREPRTAPQTHHIDASGRFVVPGYIEPHAHPWVLYNPVSLLEVAVPDGTTTLVLDNLFLFLQLGVAGLRRVLDALGDLPAHGYWVARIVSQAEWPGERELFSTEAVRQQLAWPEMAMSGEVTRWASLYQGDEGILAGLAAAKQAGKRSDGHTAGASYERLVSLVAAGISADHEAIEPEEMLQRLRLGLWVMLRGSSLRRDLPELAAGLVRAGVDTRRVMLTTDGSAPCYYREQGVMSGALRQAVEAGLSPMAALQMVTVNAATFLGLDEELGAIAPGRRADLLILEAPDRFRPEQVVVDGRVVARHGRLLAGLPQVDWDALGCRLAFERPERFADPSLYVPPARAGEAGGEGGAAWPVMIYESTVITRRRDLPLPVREGVVDLAGQPDLIYAALVDRQARWVSRAIIGGLMGSLQGLAATYNTTTQLLVLGRDPRSMAAAARRVAELRGGLAVAEGGRVVWSAPLPVAGMMTDGDFEQAARVEAELTERAEAGGYRFHDILYTLLFLTCDFLPDLRLTPRGLLEVKRGQVLVEPQRL